MYRSYWGLTSRPFDNTRDPDAYYPADSHQAALLKLRYAIDHRCEAALLTGAAGVGKSLLLHCLQRQLGDDFGLVLRLPFPQLPAEQLLAYLAHQVTPGEPRELTSEQSIRRLEAVLADQHRKGRRVLLIVDEVQAIERIATLEIFRLLLNLTCDGAPTWTILMCGQTSFLPMLSRAAELNGRFGVKCLLQPFSLDETVSYISHRLDMSGAQRPIFDDQALEVVHQLSGGVARRVHRLCDLALLIGFAEERFRIDAECVENVASELEFNAA